MAEEFSNPPKRWYDRQPRLSQSVRLLFLFPNEVKSIIADGLILIANREFAVNEQMNSFRTLGADKILGVYKSKNKRRDYDLNDVLHKAMNYLYILSDRNQDVMANHILALVGFIQEYLSACQAFKKPPTLEDVAAITAAYVERGAADVEQFLAEVRDQFYQGILDVDPDEKPVDFLDDVEMTSEMMGMRLKKRD